MAALRYHRCKRDRGRPMPQQYHATDSTTGLEVAITGEFPPDPDDRVRIARTSNLFTKLMATILATENDYERRHRFRAIETQLELAEALIRGDLGEVQQLLRSTLEGMGITEEQLREMERQLREQLHQLGADTEAFDTLFGGAEAGEEASGEVFDDRPLDDRGFDPERPPPAPDGGDAPDAPSEEPPADER